ncbi:hypothetical protein OK074_0913 [Actinobacteria bacterium OK074]|nr:hypothetical protein OK074_0913 [Actinobacteria bacterium OK074]
MVTTDLFDRALVEEATKKSGLIWVRGGVPTLDGPDGGAGSAPSAPTRALWHAWIEGAAYVVGDGPGEQPLPGLLDGGDALVTVRSKDKGGRLVAWPAKVAELTPGSPEWQTAVTELKGKRLNAPDGEAMPDRWARECRVLRLEPTGATEPLPEGSLAARPLPTPATTREPVPAGLPRLLFRRSKKPQ